MKSKVRREIFTTTRWQSSPSTMRLRHLIRDGGRADKDAALRLAVEFAQIKGDAVLEAMDASHQNMGQMEHYCFVADELGDHLDLPVALGCAATLRPACILQRLDPFTAGPLFYLAAQPQKSPAIIS